MAKKVKKKKAKAAARPTPSIPARDAKKKIRIFNNPWLWLLVFIIVGLGFRYSNAIFTPLIYPDSLQYMCIADEIQSREIFSKDYDLDEGFLRSRRVPLLYPALIAAFSFLPVEMEILGACISITLGLLTFLPLFWLGRKMESELLGICAAAIFSFQWFGLRYATPLLTEATFTFIYILIIAVSLFTFSRPRVRALVLLGFLCSLSYMTRDVGLASVFLVALAGSVYWRLIDRSPARVLIKRAGIILGVFLLASFPYLLHIRAHTGHWGLTPQMGGDQLSGQILQFGGSRIDRDMVTSELVKEGESKSKYFKGGDSGFSVLPKKILGLFKDYFSAFLSKSGWFLSVFFFTGLVLAAVFLARSKNREAVFLEVYILLWIVQLVGQYALITPYMVDERYIYPIMPLGMLVAASGMVRLGRELSNFTAGIRPAWSGRAKAIAIITPAVLVLITFITLHPEYKKFHNKMSKAGMWYKYAAGHKEVARDITARGLIKPGKVILSRKPFMSYYLDAEFELIPKTYPELIRYIEDKKGDYIVADSFVFHTLRALLEPIAFGLQPDPNPEVVNVNEKQFQVRFKRIIYAPLPNTRIIYSRHLPQYRRIITVYEIQPEDDDYLMPTGTVDEHLAETRRKLAEGDLCLALQEAEKALKLDNRSEEAYRYIILIYKKFYLISKIPYLLYPIQKVAYTLLNINPESQAAREALSFVKKKGG